MRTVAELEARLAAPSPALVDDMRRLEGDVIVLGAGGKMGPSLASLAANALSEAGKGARVTAVSRFTSAAARENLEASGVRTIAADLLDDAALQALPDCENVVYMAGTKFGTSGNESLTWAQNAYLPGRVAERYRNSRIVAFSTGNVYPFTPVTLGGSSESDRPDPVGEYAQSCLGRERVFEHFSRRNGTPVLLFRLNYAIDLRYGVLHEIAKAVLEGRPVNLATGNANVIWQGDANDFALRSLMHAASPARPLNVTGPETLSVRRVAERFAAIFGTEPRFSGEEQPSALLSNATEAFRLFGYPRVTLGEMIDWTAEWVQSGGESLNKPTHFEERRGKF